MVSQNAIPSRKHLGGYEPYVFTEQGVAMLSSILNSEQAIKVNIAIMRVFVKLREFLSSNKELAAKLSLLERKIERHDEEISAMFGAIRQLMAPPTAKKEGDRVLRKKGCLANPPVGVLKYLTVKPDPKEFHSTKRRAR